MRTNIKATNFELNDSIRDYLDKRLSALNKFIDDVDDSAMCYVEVGKTTEHHRSGDIFRAEINLHIGGSVYRGEHECTDLYSAIDKVKDEVVIELKKSKIKRSSFMRRGGRRLKEMMKGMLGRE